MTHGACGVQRAGNLKTPALRSIIMKEVRVNARLPFRNHQRDHEQRWPCFLEVPGSNSWSRGGLSGCLVKKIRLHYSNLVCLGKCCQCFEAQNTQAPFSGRGAIFGYCFCSCFVRKGPSFVPYLLRNSHLPKRPVPYADLSLLEIPM